ncbi:MAG TPA: hypothetical protein DD727_05430 [Clostridiales bacterium]|nr:hypothetical protein [Clostridiales bacterium]
MKHTRKYLRILVSSILIFLFFTSMTACTGGSRNDPSPQTSPGSRSATIKNANTANTGPGAGLTSPGASAGLPAGSPYTTAEQAAAIGYAEAVKWKSDAVLAYISPDTYFMDFDFTNTGLATRWGMEFANRTDNTQLFVHVVCGKMDYTKNLGNTRDAPLNPNLKADRPAIPLQQALKTILDNGSPKNTLPAGVFFRIEPDGGTATTDPRWTITFRFELDEGKSEIHAYSVNALNGSVYEKGTGFIQQPGSKSLTVDQLKYKPGYTAPFNEVQAVLKFYGLMNRRSFDEAFKLLDDSLLSGKGARDMWKSTYDKVASLDVKSVVVDSTRGDGSIVCLVTSFATGDKDIVESIGWGAWPVNNTRYVTVKKTGSDYRITEISTSK